MFSLYTIYTMKDILYFTLNVGCIYGGGGCEVGVIGTGGPDLLQKHMHNRFV